MQNGKVGECGLQPRGASGQSAWLDCVAPGRRPHPRIPRTIELGVCEGEGIGPEVIAAALDVLNALAAARSLRVQIERGVPIGLEAHRAEGKCLSDRAVGYFKSLFARGIPVLCGPGGGRFVYELRREFDLYCKLAPLISLPELQQASPLNRRMNEQPTDLLVVRDNIAGVYQGTWGTSRSPQDGLIASHQFQYTEAQVRRLVDAAARLAAIRRRRLSVVVKVEGVPSVSELWNSCAADACREQGVQCVPINIDYAAYRLIEQPGEFDVIVTPNLIGDIMADLGGLLIGGRGLTISANFSIRGDAVYQTGHGSASDLAGSDRANPIAQVLSLAMLLRLSCGLDAEATLIEDAIARVFRDGWRTEDLPLGGRVVGTRRMGELIADAVRQSAQSPEDHALSAVRG